MAAPPQSPTTTRPTPGQALASSQGTTTIADSVVTKVAGLATREVAGVHDLGGSSARALGNVSQRVGIDANKSQGVAVEVADHEATVEMTVVVEYGESIPKTTQDIRERVIQRVEGICGLKVTRVDIHVGDLHFPGDDDDDRPGRAA